MAWRFGRSSCRRSLAASVHLISSLMAHKVSFIVTELGADVDPLLLHVYAAFAEHERRKISERTKAALAAAKARVVKLGNPHGFSQKAHERSTTQVAAAVIRAHEAQANAFQTIIAMPYVLGRAEQVRPITLAATLAESGARPGLRILSRRRPSKPRSAYRACQRQTAGRLVPARRATSCTGKRSAEKSTMCARCTCLSG